MLCLCYTMIMKKAFILLFPQKEYLGEETDIQLFNDCIKQRYLNNNYDFIVVRYRGSDLGIVGIKPTYVIDANISFKESSPYTTKDWKYADFEYIANQVPIKNYNQIVIGGFHCFDCVEKLASQIYKTTKNVIIDSDLTEMFWYASRFQKGWDIKSYNPELKLQKVLSNDAITSLVKLKIAKERYESPIWGISQETICKLENKIQVQIEDENHTLNK